MIVAARMLPRGLSSEMQQRFWSLAMFEDFCFLRSPEIEHRCWSSVMLEGLCFLFKSRNVTAVLEFDAF